MNEEKGPIHYAHQMFIGMTIAIEAPTAIEWKFFDDYLGLVSPNFCLLFKIKMGIARVNPGNPEWYARYKVVLKCNCKSIRRLKIISDGLEIDKENALLAAFNSTDAKEVDSYKSIAGAYSSQLDSLKRDIGHLEERIKTIRSEMGKVRPDLYCRKTGRIQAVAHMEDVMADVVEIKIDANGVKYVLKAKGYIINLFAKHGAKYAYLTSAYVAT
jgi:hypothetical protein